MSLVPALRSNLLLLLIFFMGIWNILMIVNYQHAKRSIRLCSNVAINEQDTISSNYIRKSHNYLKGLRIEIEETFKKIKVKEHTFGKAFRQAALQGGNGKEGGNDSEIKTVLARSLPDCKQAPYLLILIHSTPANFMEREAIRVSWGNPQNSINMANAGQQLTPRNSFSSFFQLQHWPKHLGTHKKTGFITQGPDLILKRAWESYYDRLFQLSPAPPNNVDCELHHLSDIEPGGRGEHEKCLFGVGVLTVLTRVVRSLCKVDFICFGCRLWKTVFLLGQTRNPRLDELLQEEANVNSDMVFGEFIDSYRNLTKKMVLGIEWATEHCLQAKYVMKADEDSFVNVLELVHWLEEYHQAQGNKPLYMGAALIDRKPYRERDSPFYVSEEEYSKATYPPYISGTGYVFSGKLLMELTNSLKAVRLFPNEDACFGTLMKYIKVKPLNNERFIPFTMQMAVYSETEGYSLCEFNGPLVIHRISGKLQIQTHFNVLILKHAPTICEHIKSGIGQPDFMNVYYYIY